MELTELKFAVNTEELTTAVKKLEALGVAISDYNKVNGDKARADREAAAAAKELAKQQKAQETATKKAADAAEKAAAAQKKLASSVSDAAEEMSPLEKLLNKLNNQYGDLVSGFTKGEASILQQARSFGAAENELKPFIGVLEKIKELTKDPFDASVGAIRSVSAEFDRLTQRSNLTAQGISLTTKQLSEYSRLSAEVSGKVNQLGLDPTQGAGLAKYNTMLAESQAEYLKIAGSVNRVTEEEKQRNAVLREQEKLAASTLRAQQRALEENATAMNQAVAEFRRLEKAKADAAQSAADRIVKANQAAAESAARLNQITAMVVYQGMNEKEASKRVNMASQGVSADVINQVIAAEKNLASTRVTGTSTTTSYDAAARELVKAQKAVLTEEQKMISVLASLNDQTNNSVSFNEKAARSIFNYEQNLRKSGASAQEAAAKLAIYKRQQQDILAVEQKRQAEYLKRGLQPQIGDVAVSLAAGQNPLTVLLQQGDQIRGLIAQTGIEGAALQKVMRDALGDTVKSIQQTAVAMGSVLGGAIASAGKSITGLVTGPIAALIIGFKEADAAGSSTFTSIGSAISRAFAAGNVAFLSALPILLTTAAAAFAIFGVATYQAIKQESELSTALALSGGALGLSKDAAITYAMSLNEMGISTSKGIEVLTEMAKAGRLTAEETQMVAKAAVDMEKYAGVAIEETVKSFSKMKEKPVEALAELAIKTGMVRPQILELVAQLMEQGRVSEAAGVATKALADVTETQAQRIKDQLHPLEALYKGVGSGLKSLWDSIGNTIRSTDAEQLSDAYKRLNVYLQGNAKAHQDSIEKERILISQLSSRMRLATETSQVERIQSELARDFLEKQKLINEQEKIRDGLTQKKLTRAEAVKKAEEDALKRVKSLTTAELARIRETAGMQWDKAQASSRNKSQNELNAALNTYADIQNRAIGVNSSFNDELKKLQYLYGKNKISAGEYAAEVQLLLAQQPYAIKAKKDEADATKELIKAQETLNDILGISSGVSSSFNNELAAIQLVYAKTDMSAQAYTEAVLKLLDKQPYAIKAKQDEAKALSDLNRAQETYNDILGISSGVSADFNNKLESLQLYYNNNKISAEAYAEAVLKLLEKQPYAIKLLADEEKVRSELAKKVKEHADELNKLTEATDKYNHSLQKEYEALVLEKELMGLSEEDRTARLNILKVEQKYLEEVEAAQKAYNITFEEYMDLLAKAKANKDLGLKVVNEKADVAAIKKINDEYNKFVGNLAGAISQNIVEGGKDGSDKLRGIIEAELSKPITVFINAIIQDIFSENKSGKSFSERISSSQETFDVASKFSKFGFKGAELLSSMGFDTASEMLGQFSAGVKNASSMSGFKGAMEAGGANLAGAIGGAVLNGLSGYSISKSLAGGYAIEGLNVDLIAGIASAIPGVGPIAGVIGGLFQRAFGMAAKEIKAQGITGTFSAISGAMVSQYTDWTQKGGWFRSDKSGRDISSISNDLDRTLDSAISSMTFAAFSYANILGLSAENISGVNQAIDISLKDLTPEQQQKKITEALTGFGDKLAQSLGFETQEALAKFSEQVMSQRNALELEFLKLQENNVELRKRERDTIYRTNLPLYDRLNALKDLKEAEVKATEELKKSKDALDEFKTSGKSISDFISSLIGTVSSSAANLNMTKSAYMSNLALATSGDQAALGSITTTASSYLEQVKQTATSTTEYRKAAALVSAQLQQIPAVNLWQDSVLSKLDEVTKAVYDSAAIDSVKNAQNQMQSATETLATIKSESASQLALPADVNSTAEINNAALKSLILQQEEQARLKEELMKQQKLIAVVESVVSPYPRENDGGMGANALGNAFTGSGIYSTPTFFSTADGKPQVMGEAGPEAVMPLSRMADGSLGVRTFNTPGNSSSDSSAVLQVLMQLNANIEGMRAEVRADVTHNAKTAKLLDRVIPEGDSIAVTANFDGGLI